MECSEFFVFEDASLLEGDLLLINFSKHGLYCNLDLVDQRTKPPITAQHRLQQKPDQVAMMIIPPSWIIHLIPNFKLQKAGDLFLYLHLPTLQFSASTIALGQRHRASPTFNLTISSKTSFAALSPFSSILVKSRTTR